MEDLEDMWAQMKLIEEEMGTIDLNEEESEVVLKKGEKCLIGKVCLERVISKSIISTTMAKIWRLSKPATFMEVGANLFTHANKQKVEEVRPWLFDNRLFIIRKFDGVSQSGKMKFEHEALWVQLHNLPLAHMNCNTGEKVGNSIGRVMEIDVDEEGIEWGKCLQIKVEIDLKRSIVRGPMINASGSKVWIPFKYEKSPRLCFTCRQILHDTRLCNRQKVMSG
ncbi:uncharacterized protein LOC121240886 [Juglans microcarpa x Juglans regia]|uniref:uncharacterized protein LOC121240886 n=1 Tax=Juglans microcarpa x Juglans regia TaxID=2249226 RepID=UPI001B7F2D80|nr:uncharacterized protein LOC121240886 [Juglans microcarpa x Juglans regia]